MNKQLVVLTTSDLENMHKIQLNMLIEFDKICRRNNIKYILDAGTLLGAVRHKGFIPWDDDIDVRMLRDDYEKFCVVANKELPETMFFQNYKNDKGYPWMYSKIRMKGTKAVRIGQDRLNMEEGIYMDIFPCDGVPDDNKKKKKHNIWKLMPPNRSNSFTIMFCIFLHKFITLLIHITSWYNAYQRPP